MNLSISSIGNAPMIYSNFLFEKIENENEIINKLFFNNITDYKFANLNEDDDIDIDEWNDEEFDENWEDQFDLDDDEDDWDKIEEDIDSDEDI